MRPARAAVHASRPATAPLRAAPVPGRARGLIVPALLAVLLLLAGGGILLARSLAGGRGGSGPAVAGRPPGAPTAVVAGVVATPTPAVATPARAAPTVVPAAV